MQPSNTGKVWRGEGVTSCSFSFAICWFDLFFFFFFFFLYIHFAVHTGSFGLDLTVAYSKGYDVA